MKCKVCGAELTEGAKFCRACGAPVSGYASETDTVANESVSAEAIGAAVGRQMQIRSQIEGIRNDSALMGSELEKTRKAVITSLVIGAILTVIAWMSFGPSLHDAGSAIGMGIFLAIFCIFTPISIYWTFWALNFINFIARWFFGWIVGIPLFGLIFMFSPVIGPIALLALTHKNKKYSRAIADNNERIAVLQQTI